MKDARIENGRVEGVIYGQHFTVALNDGTTPTIDPDINFEGMPVKTLIQLAFDSMKVKGRTHMRNMSEKELKRAYSGEISWRVMIDKSRAVEQLGTANMTTGELDATIRRLQAMQNEKIEIDEN